MRLPLVYLTVICLIGCGSTPRDNVSPQQPLGHFQDANFGVRFSHTGALTISYDPHGGADRVEMSWRGKRVGGLVIRPAPPVGNVKDFITSGKEYYTTKYDASSVDYTIYESPQHYAFHYFKAKAVLGNTNHVVMERFVYLRDPKETPIEPFSMESISGAFSFEFLYQDTDYEQLKPEIQTVIDTFRLETHSSAAKPASE